MKRTTSAVALVAAAVLGAAILLGGPAIAHESKDDDGQRSRSGMMGHMMDHQMMDHMMSHGMGGHNMMGRGMMGVPGSPCNVRADIDRDLSVKDVTEMLNQRLERWETTA
jgi:hypothetical protein